LLVHNQELETDLIHQDQETGKFYCKNSGEEAERIDYFSHSAGRNVIGGWYGRYAIVCGNNYWISDEHDAFGQMIYGPFEK